MEINVINIFFRIPTRQNKKKNLNKFKYADNIVKGKILDMYLTNSSLSEYILNI